MQPGEWLKIEDGEVTDLPPLPHEASRRCIFELIYFSRPDSTVFNESVDRVLRAIRHAARRTTESSG